MTFVRKLVKCANFYNEHKNSIEIETTLNPKSKFVKLSRNVFDNDGQLSIYDEKYLLWIINKKTKENIQHSL